MLSNVIQTSDSQWVTLVKETMVETTEAQVDIEQSLQSVRFEAGHPYITRVLRNLCEVHISPQFSQIRQNVSLNFKIH